MEQKLRANIWKFYLFNVFFGFVLYYAIDKIFMEARGLSVTEIVLVEIIFGALVILLEVPSGALSDRWSRKYVLALSVVFFMLNTWLWAVAHSVNVFMLGAMAASIHVALASGTDTSFLYDTLKQLSREGKFDKVYGRAIFFESMAAIAAGIAGAMIVQYFDLVVPFWLTLGFSFIALIIALTLTEPRIHRSTGEVSYWKHITQTGKYLWKHPFIVHLIALAVMLEATLGLLDEYGQLYFVGVGVPLFLLGYLAAAGSGIEALGGWISYRLNRFNRRTMFTMAIALSAVGFLVVGLTKSWVGVVFSFLPWIAYYFISPLLLSDFHKELPSSRRATSESFMSLSRQMLLIPMAFGFAFLADHQSIFVAYTAVGVIVTIYLVIFLVASVRKIGKHGELVDT